MCWLARWALVTVALVGYGSAFGDFVYEDFSSVEGLVFLGPAQQDGNTLRLNPSTQATYGHAWREEPEYLVDGFRTSFEFRVSELVYGGADLIDFFIVAHDTGPAAPGIRVRVDTFQNPGEPNGNFASVLNSEEPYWTIGAVPLLFNASDGGVHSVEIVYDSIDHRLTVAFEDEAVPLIDIPLNLAEEIPLIDGTAWLGFTGGTGYGAWERHDIHSWSLESFEPEPLPSVFLSDVGEVGVGVDPSEIPELNLTPGSSGSLWVWVTDEQPVDTTFALDAFSDTPGVIHFTGAEVLNADVTVDGLVVDTRWQGIGNGSVEADGQSIRNIVGISVTDGTGLDPNNNGVDSGLLDVAYDVAAGAFLFARVDFDVVGEGVTNLSFGEGSALIVHAGVDVAHRFDLGTNKGIIMTMSLGDMNLDGEVNGLDIDLFVHAVVFEPFNLLGDMNEDGIVTGLDVAPFVAAVIAGNSQAVPEPSTLILATAALLALPWRRPTRR